MLGCVQLQDGHVVQRKYFDMGQRGDEDDGAVMSMIASPEVGLHSAFREQRILLELR